MSKSKSNGHAVDAHTGISTVSGGEKMPLVQCVRERIEQERLSRKLSKAGLAARAKMSRSELANFLNGRVDEKKGITLGTLDRLATALGVPAATLTMHPKDFS